MVSFHLFLKRAKFLQSILQKKDNDLEKKDCKKNAIRLIRSNKRINYLFRSLSKIPRDGSKNRILERSLIIRDIFLITKNQYVALEICRLANREANSKAKTLT
jgi:hypothetical protein